MGIDTFTLEREIHYVRLFQAVEKGDFFLLVDFATMIHARNRVDRERYFCSIKGGDDIEAHFPLITGEASLSSRVYLWALDFTFPDEAIDVAFFFVFDTRPSMYGDS